MQLAFSDGTDSIVYQWDQQVRALQGLYIMY
jgi:hypothetical protein